MAKKIFNRQVHNLLKAPIEKLSRWECGFLNDLCDQLDRGRPVSPKQQAILDRIQTKIGG